MDIIPAFELTVLSSILLHFPPRHALRLRGKGHADGCNGLVVVAKGIHIMAVADTLQRFFGRFVEFELKNENAVGCQHGRIHAAGGGVQFAAGIRADDRKDEVHQGVKKLFLMVDVIVIRHRLNQVVDDLYGPFHIVFTERRHDIGAVRHRGAGMRIFTQQKLRKGSPAERGVELAAFGPASVDEPHPGRWRWESYLRAL